MKNLIPLTFFILLTAFFLTQTGCSSKPMKDPKAEAKLDAPLRMKLSEVKQESTDAPLKCLVKLTGSLDDEQQKMLEKAGVSILSAVKDIITIEGKRDAIRRLARYDFVHSISLSQTRYPPKEQ